MAARQLPQLEVVESNQYRRFVIRLRGEGDAPCGDVTVFRYQYHGAVDRADDDAALHEDADAIDREVVGGDGGVWTVLTSLPDADQGTAFIQSAATDEIQQVTGDTSTASVGPKGPGPTAESIGDLPFDLGLTEEQLQNAPFEEMNFFKSTHGSGGKYKHYPLHQLKPGDSFRVSGDKTVWKLVKVLGGGYALVYAPNLGSVLKVKDEGKVKKV